MMKVCELAGAKLDYWAARANGMPAGGKPGSVPLMFEDGAMKNVPFKPSLLWVVGGPIIERENITVIASKGADGAQPLEWSASVGAYSHYIDEGLPLSGYDGRSGTGPTALVAAMRAYVASKFGEEVPDE